MRHLAIGRTAPWFVGGFLLVSLLSVDNLLTVVDMAGGVEHPTVGYLFTVASVCTGWMVYTGQIDYTGPAMPTESHRWTLLDPVGLVNLSPLVFRFGSSPWFGRFTDHRSTVCTHGATSLSWYKGRGSLRLDSRKGLF